MRRQVPAVALLALSLVFAGSAQSRVSGDLLPNLVEVPPSYVHVSPAVTGGGYELRFTATAGNNGAGPLELHAARPKTSARFTVVQRVALAGVGTRTRTLNVTL